MAHKESSSAYNRSILLTVIMLSSLFNPFMSAGVNIALPSMSTDLSMNAVKLSWVPMSFLLASAVMLVPFGKLADIWGRRKMLLYGNVLFTLATILCALAKTGNMIIAMRALQGIGSAMSISSGMAILVSAFPAQKRGFVIGLNTSAVYIGLSVAPLLGGIITQSLGWQSLFFINAVTGLCIITGILLGVKAEWAEGGAEKFDIRGSVIYVMAMLALMYGFSQLPGKIATLLTLAGISGLIVFIIFEERIAFPVLNIHLFRNNRIFAFSNLAALINYAATFAITFVMSLYLQHVMGLSPGYAGMIMATQPAVMAIVATVAGRLSDRIDSGILSSAGMTIIVAGLILLTFLSTGTSHGYILIALTILGFGFGMFSSPNTNAIMSAVEKKYLGIASATLSTMRLTGQMFSMAIAAMAIHLFIGNSPISTASTPGFMQSVRIIFIVFAVLCFLGVFASLARGKKQNLFQ